MFFRLLAVRMRKCYLKTGTIKASGFFSSGSFSSSSLNAKKINQTESKKQVDFNNGLVSSSFTLGLVFSMFFRLLAVRMRKC